MQVQLSPAQIRWLLACIRATDHTQATAHTFVKCDFYEPVVLELLSHLNRTTAK